MKEMVEERVKVLDELFYLRMKARAAVAMVRASQARLRMPRMPARRVTCLWVIFRGSSQASTCQGFTYL